MYSTILIALILSTLQNAALSAASRAESLLEKPDSWFSSDEGRETMACILSWQSDHGDWPKNTDTANKFGGQFLNGFEFNPEARSGSLNWLAGW